GIWQTVWLEAVPQRYVSDLKIEPDLDGGAVRVTFRTEGQPRNVGSYSLVVLEDGREVARTVGSGPGSGSLLPMWLRIPRIHKWAPSDPFLYTLRLSLSSGDEVESYFGMRRIAVRAERG